MSVGLYVWVGVRHDLDVWQDHYADARTVAPDEATCQQRIDELVEEGIELTPSNRMLILKGRISDR